MADVDQVADGLLIGFTQLFTGVITILGTLGFMLAVNPVITLVVVLITPVSLFVAAFIAKHTYDMFRLQSETRGAQTAMIDEMISGQNIVQAFTNLITNPVMNILLGMFELIVAPAHAWQHLLTVCVLEAVVIWIEYSIYLKRYKDRTKGILFLFTLLANAASWGLIELIRIWI